MQVLCDSNLHGPKAYLDQKQMRDLRALNFKRHGDPRIFGKGKIFDGYPYYNKRTAHFFKRLMSREQVMAGRMNPSDFEETVLERI